MELIASLGDFLEYDFLLYALLATICLSVSAGLISPFIIAKKYAFIGSAISHSTLLGLAISVGVLAQSASLEVFVTTLLITLVLTIFLSWATYHQKLPSDSLIGIFFSSTMGIGILVHTLFAKDSANLMSYLFGNILLLDSSDLIISALVSLIVILAMLMSFKKWVYLTYDQVGAEISGINTKLYHHLFFILLTVLIISAIKVAGTVLINTLLLVPGFFALKLVKDLKTVMLVSVAFSVVASIMGLILANYWNLPSGATLAVVQFLLMLTYPIIKIVKERLQS